MTFSLVSRKFLGVRNIALYSVSIICTLPRFLCRNVILINFMQIFRRSKKKSWHKSKGILQAKKECKIWHTPVCISMYIYVDLHICRSCFRSLYTVLSFDWYMSLDNIFLRNKTDTHRHYNNVSWWHFYWDKLRWQLPSVELLLSKSTTTHYSRNFQICPKNYEAIGAWLLSFVKRCWNIKGYCYSVCHIITYPSKELCSKMALGEVGVYLPWWCHTLVLPSPGYSGLFLNLIIFS